MSLGMTVFMFGVLLVILPGLTSPMSEDEYIRWLAKQPLHRILAFKYAAISGMLIAGFGALLNAMR